MRHLNPRLYYNNRPTYKRGTVIRGCVFDITNKLNANSASILAQWIGGANVVRNQKIADNKIAYQNFKDEKSERPVVNQQVSYISKKPEFEFLKAVPSQIKRNAAANWMSDMQAMFKGERKAPKIKGKSKKRSCYVTSELFVADRLNDNECIIRVRRSASKKDRFNYILHVRMPFTKGDAANSLRISRQGRRFWLSMAYRKEFDVPTEQELRNSLSKMESADLVGLVEGYDIGVARQVTSSSGTVFHIRDEQAEQLKRLEARKIRYQRRYARVSRTNDKKAGTKKRKRTGNEKSLSEKLAQLDAKRARIRFNESHHISKAIAEDTPMVAGFEDINLQNLTRKPKAKQCPDTGKWLRNNARAKSGLNKVILNLSLGQIRDFSKYKLAERGKLMVKVKAAYSSQECSKCGHTEKANRPDQQTFVCQSCGYTANADDNASAVVAKRTITLILSPEFTKGVKKAKRISVTKSKERDTASLGIRGHVSRQLGRDSHDDEPNGMLTC